MTKRSEGRHPTAEGRHDTDIDALRFPEGGRRFVSASFDNLDNALDATRDLEDRGYPRDHVSVFMADERRQHYIDTHPRWEELEEKAVVVEEVALEKRRKTAEGAGTGGAIGGAVGATGAALAAVGTTLVIPPLGIAVAGPLAAIFAGLGAGAAAGGMVGALVGAGMSEYRAKHFQKLVSDGKVVVGVIAETEPERRDVSEVLDKHGGKLVPDKDD